MPEDTRHKMEDKWFAENEESLLREARRSHERKLKELAGRQQKGEERELRELHYLKCPKCGHDMRVTTQDGIEVEVCGTCEGIFLDKGELLELGLKPVAERRSWLRRILGLGG